ncbi:hypothetical protein AMR72_12370 [Flavobacterium psychrophilum]|nr:hypothetical protein AMR72_12370 [Flavobacterium psychrophilum]AOE53245.1 hypothetical protein ALW18_12360 [Flavobacterium psychrophilum]
MQHYKAIFRLPGGKELEAERGYVSDAFFDAIQKVTVDDIVEIFEGGFVLNTGMHEKLSIPDSFGNYAIVGLKAPDGSETDPNFLNQLLDFLKRTNHARPLEMHYNYQIFIMEYIEEVPEDD